MPQLDLHSYFSAATYLIILFLTLVFVLHTYFLPKIASCLKFRKKIESKQETEEPFLELAQNYLNEMEKILKRQTNK